MNKYKKIWKFINHILDKSCHNIKDISKKLIIDEIKKNIFHTNKKKEIFKILMISTKTLIEREYNYNYVVSNILIQYLYYKICLIKKIDFKLFNAKYYYSLIFKQFIKKGIKYSILNKNLSKFNINKLCKHINYKLDYKFTYIGLQTLYDRYLISFKNKLLELPQIFFMRISMGLSQKEKNKNYWALKFYKILSNMDFMTSTPTLFNAGTQKPQLSSCFLTTIPDDLSGIYSSIKDNALLSKFAGGIGNDWTNVRALGSYIKSTNGKSLGIVPFLNVANATAIAVNQGGKRKGAVCAYLETWHMDIEEFLELKKNTGDDRRRTHDMNTANWIPDLFMRRVIKNKNWTLFSPEDVKNLHNKFGIEFDNLYKYYEKQAQKKIIKCKIISAVSLWRKMLNMLFETGHPWIVFKDPCNIRSPQQHSGIINSSNLCTEITLNTSNKEVAVCNLGSINLVNHIYKKKINKKKLKHTIKIAIRILDNVIDLNYYSIPQAKYSNKKHRPIGLGIMGFQDILYVKKIPYNTKKALVLSDKLMEFISYYAIKSSMKLSKKRGSYKSYKNSLWDKSILPIDSLKMLKKYRKQYLKYNTKITLNWNKLRKKINKYGMRNSNILAIAPTATISNICGVTPSIEPNYKNIFVKSNLSGEFTILNKYLLKDLKKLNIWNNEVLNNIKYYNGSIQNIKSIPYKLKSLYLNAMEIDSIWLVKAAALRQKWIDQSQSLNLYVAGVSGKKLDKIYKTAWLYGIKSTYYLRSTSASEIEKFTVDKIKEECDLCQ